MFTGPDGIYIETPSVLKIAGLAYSTLDYWVRSELVTPSIRPGEGKRKARRWSMQDVVVVKALKTLRDAGASVAMMGRARDALQGDWVPTLTSRMLYWGGGDIVQIDEWENLVSLVRHPGQSVVRIVAIELDSIAREFEGEVVRLAAVQQDRRAARA